MTDKEMQAKTAEKVEKIKALCTELKITLSPEQVVLPNGIIKGVIYYLDNEEYPRVEAPTPDA